MSTGKTIVRRHLISGNGNLPEELHPVIRRLYQTRKVASADELNLSLDCLIPPERLKGIDQAVGLLVEALKHHKRILIVADFDADGATSCVLALRALRSFGAKNVRYIVPNRFEFGYGLTPGIVSLAAREEPDVIITVDNGITSVEGVAEARKLGIDVLVTDHHLPGNVLPAAAALVNPNQPGDGFPSKCLAGVGVIFYLMLALRACLRQMSWFVKANIPEPNLAKLLDLVALGTVADVVPLDYNNRILVAQGLKRIAQGTACLGIEALLRAGGRDPKRVATADLGFIVGPRLNAAGRLTDMSLGIECLLTDDPTDAQRMAGQLDLLNHDRRAIEADMQSQALMAIQKLQIESQPLPRGLCLFDETWHQGVIGLVASRIKELTHRPVIAFAPSNDREIKGSARSVTGLHIRDALDAIAVRDPRLLNRFGGHAMAAGLTLNRADLEEFRAAFDEEVGRHLTEDDFSGKIFSDGPLSVDELTLSLAEQIRAAGPWGQGFPEPVFDGYFQVLNQRLVAGKHLKLTLRLPDHPTAIDAIAFNSAHDGKPPAYQNIRTAYKLDVNEFQGNRALQLIVDHLEQAEVETIDTGA